MLFVDFKMICPIANLNGWTLVIDPHSAGAHQVTSARQSEVSYWGLLLSSTICYCLPALGYLWGVVCYFREAVAGLQI